MLSLVFSLSGRTISTSGTTGPFRAFPKSLSVDFGGLSHPQPHTLPQSLSQQQQPAGTGQTTQQVSGSSAQDRYAAVSHLDSVFSDTSSTTGGKSTSHVHVRIQFNSYIVCVTFRYERQKQWNVRGVLFHVILVLYFILGDKLTDSANMTPVFAVRRLSHENGFRNLASNTFSLCFRLCPRESVLQNAGRLLRVEQRTFCLTGTSSDTVNATAVCLWIGTARLLKVFQ